ncbi:MAG TPA: hypothetical protein PLU71_04055 [Candidatus Dependentiae bacterium]|nr:hypothetical protein [Candidatus Dependentiae bacterium]HRQ63006.1 hypothetical protein [Candidatus Dependentiae bacterium]
MKITPIIILSTLLIHVHTTQTSYFKSLFAITVCSVSIVGIYTLFKPRTPEPFIPSKDNLNVYTFGPAQSIDHTHDIQTSIGINDLVDTIVQNKKSEHVQLVVTDDQQKPQKIVSVDRGIKPYPDHKVIFISSRGYAKRNVPLTDDYLELIKNGGCAIAAHAFIKDNIIHDAPCITFDYPDTRDYFNFGQDLDVACLKTVWNEVTKLHPHADLVGIGDCRGGKALLEFATEQPKNLKALVLLSPFVSTKDMTNQLAKSYLNWLPKSDILLYNFFDRYFPSFNTARDNLLDKAHLISPTLPIFIGYRKNDRLASLQSMYDLMSILRSHGNQYVHFVAVSDDHATHSRITPIAKLQCSVNAFLAIYGLPHSPELAQAGIHHLFKKNSFKLTLAPIGN